MERKITVKGTGYASVKPDLMVLTIDVRSIDFDYEIAMKKASDASHQLVDAVTAVEFAKDDLKTTDFRINTDYKSQKTNDGTYKSIFNGYVCRQDFRLEFELDFTRLSQVLTAISKLSFRPELEIEFTVKDTNSVSETLLRSATINAREKAEILADASGIKLGDLLDIYYNWGRIDLYSTTNYQTRESPQMLSESINPYIAPEDISVQDTVTFVWAIQ